MPAFIVDLFEILQVAFTVLIGWMLFSQLWQLASPLGQAMALDYTRKTLVHNSPRFIILMQILGVGGVAIGFGQIAASLLVISYCVEWAKICTVLQRQRA